MGGRAVLAQPVLREFCPRHEEDGDSGDGDDDNCYWGRKAEKLGAQTEARGFL